MSLNLLISGSQAACLYSARKDAPAALPYDPIDRPPLVANNATARALTFKILQLADLHLTGDPNTRCREAPEEIGSMRCTEALTTKYVNNLLGLETPDFVVFSGDNVETFESSLRHMAMDAATEGVEARKIPYAMIFGNHDDENGFSREMMVKMAMAKPHSYTQRGPAEVFGVGNYELNIKAPVDGPWGDAGSDVFRMYFLDSNAYPDKSKLPDVDTTYDWIRPSQVAYYRQMSAAHQIDQVPAVMFFHIPLPEYAMDPKSRRTGEHREPVSSSEVHSNLFSALVETGEVKATFSGHDHINDYCYKRDSVQPCYGGATGLGQAYARQEVRRRARVIEWSVNSEKKREIRTWKRVFDKWTTRLDEQVLFSE